MWVPKKLSGYLSIRFNGGILWFTSVREIKTVTKTRINFKGISIAMRQCIFKYFTEHYGSHNENEYTQTDQTASNIFQLSWKVLKKKLKL